MGRSITGVVVSNVADKTIVISVTEKKTHPVYKKQYTRKKRFMAHDRANAANLGDLVQITEIRPMSAKKRFKLLKIVERAGTKFEEADATADVEELAPEAVEAKKETKKDTK